MKLTITLEFSQRQARDLIGDAYSMYWLRDFEPKWDSEKCVLTLGKRTAEDATAKRMRISARTIAQTLRRALKDKKNAHHRMIAMQIITDSAEVDGDTRDSILQLAVFDDLVYG